MKSQTSETFLLDNFEGPLDLLWHLINRQEIDIYEISLRRITAQFLEKSQQALVKGLDNGAEFIALAASLLWYKSKTLLPKHEQQPEELLAEEEYDPRFEVIHQLLDYCRFKQAAKGLTEREQQQAAFYPRGIESGIAKKNLGIAHLSLDDLAALFKEILAKSMPHKGVIHEEIWKVSDKIAALRDLLEEQKSILFENVFTFDKSREELIVTFLALLELMKAGFIRVVTDPVQNAVCIQANL